MVNRRMASPKYLLILVITIGLLSGCNSDSSTADRSDLDLSDGTIAGCLMDSGATFAESSDELGFLSEANEEIAKAFTFDKKADLIVDLWEKFQERDQPSEWLMWFGQPFGQGESPFEIADKGADGSYVAYVLKPTDAERRAVEGCTA